MSAAFLLLLLRLHLFLNRQLRMAVFLAGPQLQVHDGSPDLSREFRLAVFPAGPQLRASAGNLPRRTSTASSGWQCSPTCFGVLLFKRRGSLFSLLLLLQQ